MSEGTVSLDAVDEIIAEVSLEEASAINFYHRYNRFGTVMVRGLRGSLQAIKPLSNTDSVGNRFVVCIRLRPPSTAEPVETECQEVIDKLWEEKRFRSTDTGEPVS
jgi:hypothetical protein